MSSPVQPRPVRSERAFAATRYVQEPGRDQRLDFLRGLFVAVLIVDHIAGWSPFYLLTGGGDFYVSAAEGFICISGFLFGRIYHGVVERAGMRAVFAKALSRALYVYVVYMTATALVVIVGTLTHSRLWHMVQSSEEFMNYLWRTATFESWLHHTRILAMYSLIIAAAPFAIWSLSKGRPLLLLAASWFLYLLYQLSPLYFSWPLPIDAGFHPYAYQLFFVHLLVVGYHRGRVSEFFVAHREWAVFRLGAAGMLVLIAIYAVQHHGIPGWLGPQTWLGPLFIREFLRPGRLVAVLFAVPFLFLLVTYAWLPIEKRVRPFFDTLGRHALFAYAAHLPAVVFFDWLWPVWGHLRWVRNGLNAAAQVLVVFLIWALIRTSERLRILHA